jgi:hypothetical protein
MSALEKSVSEPLNHTSIDYNFQNYFPQINFKSQFVDERTWAGVKSIYEEITRKNSIFTVQANSEISFRLRLFFEFTLSVIMKYQQDEKLINQFMYLYEISTNFLKEGASQTMESPELVERKFYKYPRTICFSFFDNLSRFSSEMTENCKIDKSDEETYFEFANSIENSNMIVDIFGRSLTVDKEFCFEQYKNLDDEKNAEEVLEQESPNNEAIVNEEKEPTKEVPEEELKVEKNDDDQEFDPKLLNQKRKKIDSAFPNNELSENIEELVGELPDFKLIKEDLLADANEPTQEDFGINFNLVLGNASPKKIITRIVIIEIFECNLCLNDSLLSIFVSKLLIIG